MNIILISNKQVKYDFIKLRQRYYNFLNFAREICFFMRFGVFLIKKTPTRRLAKIIL